MANKPLQFVLVERKMGVGSRKGEVVKVALPTGRQRVSFRNFCERVAKSTTFNRQEVEAVLNYATEIARDIVANGDIVEFGDLGTLKPSFKSKMVPKDETFNVQKHIEKPVVKLAPSRKYFTLDDVSYEQTTVKPKKSKGGASGTKPAEEQGGGTPGGTSESGGI